MTAWRLAPHVRQTLQTLQAEGYKLALLSNYNCDRVFQRSIDYLGLREFFDICLCSAAVEYRKPDTRFFQIVLDRWDVLPYETVVVGDSLADDISGGLELGAMTVLLQGSTVPQVEHQNQELAVQLLPDFKPVPLSALMAMTVACGVAGAPADIENASLLGDRLPALPTTPADALAGRKSATVAGLALPLAASASAAMPAT